MLLNAVIVVIVLCPLGWDEWNEATQNDEAEE